MGLPFTLAQFLDAFHRYNDAIGFAPAVLLALALALVAVAHRRVQWRDKAVSGGLAALWLWAGVIYHWIFFAPINPAARLFGALFVAQAVILLFEGVVRSRLQFDPRASGTNLVGWLLIAYALVVYPIIGWSMGHGYPAGPSFGAPCPMVVFFFGMMFWTVGKVPVGSIVVPVAWAVVGTSAAVQLGIGEDFGLAIAAALCIGEQVRRRTT